MSLVGEEQILSQIDRATSNLTRALSNLQSTSIPAALQQYLTIILSLRQLTYQMDQLLSKQAAAPPSLKIPTGGGIRADIQLAYLYQQYLETLQLLRTSFFRLLRSDPTLARQQLTEILQRLQTFTERVNTLARQAAPVSVRTVFGTPLPPSVLVVPTQEEQERKVMGELMREERQKREQIEQAYTRYLEQQRQAFLAEQQAALESESESELESESQPGAAPV